jgi:histidinol-phosphate aminotransferase
MLDFSVNTNVLGPNTALVDVWRNAPLSAYPDPTYTRARQALAALHDWDSEGVVLGVGASELLHRIVRVFVPASGRVISFGAPFGEFARACELQSARLEIRPRTSSLMGASAHLAYLSNPHSPTAHVRDLASDTNAIVALGGVVVVDEAYAPFAEALTALPMLPNLIRVHSPGKAHGLLGMRMAYALTTPALARRLVRLQPAWAIPSALAAALTALPSQQAFVAETIPIVRSWARELALTMGAQPSGLHFFTIDVGDAAYVARALLARGIRVRDCASFGYPNLIRVATRTRDENARLIAAWQHL